jgi:hypothetical protein
VGGKEGQASKKNAQKKGDLPGVHRIQYRENTDILIIFIQFD